MAKWITLGLFINLHKKMAFMDNVIFAEINSYYVPLCIGPLKLMDFNDLHLLFGITGFWTDVYIFLYIYRYNIMGCYDFKVLYLQNYSSDFYETYRF